MFAECISSFSMATHTGAAAQSVLYSYSIYNCTVYNPDALPHTDQPQKSAGAVLPDHGEPIWTPAALLLSGAPLNSSCSSLSEVRSSRSRRPSPGTGAPDPGTAAGAPLWQYLLGKGCLRLHWVSGLWNDKTNVPKSFRNDSIPCFWHRSIGFLCSRELSWLKVVCFSLIITICCLFLNVMTIIAEISFFPLNSIKWMH